MSYGATGAPPAPTPAAPKRPGTLGYWLAGLVALAGVAVGALIVIDTVRQVTSTKLPRMLAPGRMEFTLDEPGTYRVFHEHRSRFRGRAYDTPSLPPGLDLRLTEADTGQEVTLRESNAGVTYHVNERHGRSLASFRADRAGAFVLDAGYGESYEPTEAVLAVGRIELLQWMGRFVLGIAVAGLGVLLAVVLLVITLVRRGRSAGRPAHGPPPPVGPPAR